MKALSGNNSKKAFGNVSETNFGIPQGTLQRMSSEHSCLGFNSSYLDFVKDFNKAVGSN